MPARLTLALWVALALLIVDALLELSFVSAMVGWLHRFGGGDFEVNYNGSTYLLHGKPLNMLVNEGHTSNGAAGTALILVGFWGVLALALRDRAGALGRGLYYVWLFWVIPSVCLTLAAFTYTMAVVWEHTGQEIVNSVAAQLDNQPYPNFVPYPLYTWTPQNWYQAVTKLDLVDGSDRSNINFHLNIIRGWEYNLIPMFILGMAVALIAFSELLLVRRRSSVAQFNEVPHHKSMSSA